jgi:hypothetical protein
MLVEGCPSVNSETLTVFETFDGPGQKSLMEAIQVVHLLGGGMK